MRATRPLNASPTILAPLRLAALLEVEIELEAVGEPEAPADPVKLATVAVVDAELRVLEDKTLMVVIDDGAKITQLSVFHSMNRPSTRTNVKYLVTTKQRPALT